MPRRRPENTETPVCYGNIHFERLAKTMERCDNDGTPCENCINFDECLKWWDSNVCSREMISSRLKSFITHAHGLQRAKREGG